MRQRETIDREEGSDARGIANFILDNFDPIEYDLSNLKINKLMFFAHGFYSARYSRKLIRNHFEAWENGPVVRVVFNAFKTNGSSPIKNRATIFDYVTEKGVIARCEDLQQSEYNYLKLVVSHYIKFSAGELVGMTHRQGTPWQRARSSLLGSERIRDRIPDEWIKEYFVENYGHQYGN